MRDTASSKRVAPKLRRILVAASQALAGGPEGLAMSAVARDAGVAEATLYRLFGSKRGLYEEVMTWTATKALGPEVGHHDGFRAGAMAATSRESAPELGPDALRSLVGVEFGGRSARIWAGRGRILEAATRVFARLGFHQATMADIAKEAGISVGGIYNFFSSKEELFSALVLGKMEDFTSSLRRAVAEASSPLERVKRLVSQPLRFLDENRGLVVSYVSVAGGAAYQFPGGLGQEASDWYRSYLQWLSSIFRDGLREGCFKGFGAEDMACSLVGMINAIAVRWAESGDPEPLASKAPLLCDLFLNGILTAGRLQP
ncbi:MAG: TetR/AcrR family transcriptional regulator [Chloroflexota bacterium]|nr:TetR/AcrR family transcriptional regulator [Chloroflexota bacterium]